MNTYGFPILIAFIFFSLLAFLIAIPWALYQYRKYGYFSLWKTLLLASFIFYVFSAFFLVILPLPNSRQNCPPGVMSHLGTMQVKPFQFIRDIQQETGIRWSQPASYNRLLGARSVLQVLFNILLLFPLGVYLRFWLKEKSHMLLAGLIGFSVSLFFEITQWTALYGYYECAYRLFDVDDLLANTFGTLLGFLLAPLLLAFFPSRAALKKQDQKIAAVEEATLGAQLVSVLIDLASAQLMASFLTTLLQTQIPNSLPHQTILHQICFAGTLFILLVIIPSIKPGWTIGTAFIKARLVPSHSPKKSYIKRFIAIYSFFFLLAIATFLQAMYPQATMGWPVLLNLGAWLFAMSIYTVTLLYLGIRLIRKNQPFYFNQYSEIKTIQHSISKKDVYK